MALATLFPMSVYLMLALSSFVLMYAEGAVFPSVMTLPLTLIAYLYSERKSVIVLSGWMANLMGILALGFAAQEFFSENIEGRLLSGAHLLVYLSWLVIFLTKTRQHYWWTIALSLLQVAVSSVLMNDAEYGLFLIFFMAMSIWTVSLFTLFLAYRDEIEDDETALTDVESGMSQRLSPHHVESSQGQILFGMPSRSIGGVEYDAHAKWIGVRFALRAIGMTAACLMIGVVFFMCVPRLWADLNPFENESLEGVQVKFDQKVRLGDMGNILESRQLALTVQIFEGESKVSVPMEKFLTRHGWDEPYFRGTAMDYYANDYTWSASRKTTFPVTPAISGYKNSYRQHIELEAVGTPFLFVMHPVETVKIESPKKERYFFDGVYSTLMRQNNRNLSNRIIYDAFSPRYPVTNQFLVEDILDHPRASDLNRLFLQFPEKSLPNVRALSMKVAGLTEEEIPVPAGQRQAQVARKIVSHLRDSGTYKYSLNSEIIDPEIDPVEDFLFNRKEGHCEYYASALALMLRSVGIPTRMVNGYKGGALNSNSGIWTVQQRHAHAWVEAYYNGIWNSLDATPAAERDEVVKAVGNERMSWMEIKQYLNSMWVRYFVSMNFNFQRRNIYRMTVDELKAIGVSLWDSLRSGVSQIIEFLKHPEKWFSLRGGLIAFVLLSLLTGIVLLAKWSLAKIRRWLGRRKQSSRRRRQVEFYERFLRLCERQSLVKSSTQTPREFARRVADLWSPILSENGLGALPSSLVEKFYAIRYGEELLPSSEEEELLSTLQKLEKAFQQPQNGKPAPTTAG